jgi:hypothetical protein
MIGLKSIARLSPRLRMIADRDAASAIRAPTRAGSQEERDALGRPVGTLAFVGLSWSIWLGLCVLQAVHRAERWSIPRRGPNDSLNRNDCLDLRGVASAKIASNNGQ